LEADGKLTLSLLVAADFDTGRDGIAYEWETKNELDPRNGAESNALNASGYTRLEEYFNSLVAVQ
jgi:hypothetical protein